MPGPLLHFLGIDAEAGSYFQEPLTRPAFDRRLDGRPLEPDGVTTGIRLGTSPNSLAEAGWGLVLPAGIDPAIREALGPLLALRRELAEGEGPGRFWEITYRGGSGAALLESHGASLGGSVDPTKFPYYVLLVGAPTQIPFEVQHRLARSHLVGRLCLDTPEAYHLYASQVVAHAGGAFRRPRRAVVFGVSHSDDPATESSLEHLARPVHEDLGALAEWQVEGIFGNEATKVRLSGLLGGDETPAFLFTAAHSVCYRPDSKVLRRKQGGILCADWPGPVQWPEPNPSEHYLVAEDLDDGLDLRGLITCHFGCYTAGTPLRDSFPAMVNGVVTEGKRLAPEPFVAALPQRLLGHPRGALAVIGHVDRSWAHSFHWGEIPGQVAAFESSFRGLMGGLSAGRAIEPFAERRGVIAEDIAEYWPSQRRPRPEHQATARELWIRYHDAKSYVLLGDPAVRLHFLDA